MSDARAELTGRRGSANVHGTLTRGEQMGTQVGYVTEEEFLARYGPDDRVELVDGVVVPKYGAEGPLSPTGGAHGRIVSDLTFALETYARTHGAGEVFTDPTAFGLSEHPRRMRCPDVGTPG